MSAQVPPGVLQLTPTRYRNPEALPPGGVLIVGAAASGIQLADEIRASGRDVVLSVGRHLRLPRRYRGRDILWWMDRMGIFDETPDEVYDHEVSREQPSLQLVGRPDRASLDIGRLRRRGVQLAGRLAGIADGRAYFDDDLIATSAGSDVKLARLLERIDSFAEQTGLDRGEAEPFEPLWPLFAGCVTPERVDLRAQRIGTVIWATGFRRHYPWLHVPVFDDRGEIRQRGGVTDVPGLYVIGLQFMRRRKSAFVDGVGDDAAALAAHLAGAGREPARGGRHASASREAPGDGARSRTGVPRPPLASASVPARGRERLSSPSGPWERT
jgi:putative flavoprotein involved in K+ transport